MSQLRQYLDLSTKGKFDEGRFCKQVLLSANNKDTKRGRICNKQLTLDSNELCFMKA